MEGDGPTQPQADLLVEARYVAFCQSPWAAQSWEALEDHDPEGLCCPFPCFCHSMAQECSYEVHRTGNTGQQRSAKHFVHVHCPGICSRDPQRSRMKKYTMQFGVMPRVYSDNARSTLFPPIIAYTSSSPLIPATWPRATCHPPLTTCV